MSKVSIRLPAALSNFFGQEPRQLTPKEQLLIEDIKRSRLGIAAASSLECVLLGETTRFVGLSEGEIDCIRDSARHRGVELPI